jgi:23S rRNA (cytidine1920-2'-O)/16S rRNA (cytidine1409-2'-O)-methyltransferase
LLIIRQGGDVTLPKQRLDTLLVELNFCNSRQLAQRLIRAGEVRVDQQLIDKPGTQISPDAQITVKERPPYVSRGGEKLARALQTFPIAVCDRISLDGGISTGGFTDCLLQHGARQVYGVDVGYGQVAWKLRTDPRVILKERTNIRYLKPEDLYLPDAQLPDLGVMDVSFISLTKVLPAFWALLQPPREVVLLVKPQFEVGQDRIGKKGVVKDPVAQGGAIATVLIAAEALGWYYAGLTWSPCPGPAGNIEFLLWLQMQPQAERPDSADLKQIAEMAQADLKRSE